MLGTLRLGVVGSLSDAKEVRARCSARVPTALVAHAEEGWEQVTLNRLYEDCEQTPRRDEDVAVLYTHSKGVTSPSALNDAWRQSMTRCLVYDWASCIEWLSRVEAVGCHWLTPERWPDCVTLPYFGGNFWWTRPEVLLRGGPCSVENRHEAETWLGSRRLSQVSDCSPGWPRFDTFRG